MGQSVRLGEARFDGRNGELAHREGAAIAEDDVDVDPVGPHRVDVDVVLCDRGALPRGELAVPFVEETLAQPDRLAHDPARLAAALVDLVG